MTGPVVLLTEDGGKDARLTVQRVVHHILIMAHGSDWQRRRTIEGLSYETPGEPIQRALSGQRWRSTHPRDRQTKLELSRYLADRLRSAHGIVVFHVDGDCPWSQRPSTTLAVFEQFLEREVAHLVTDPPALKQRALAPTPTPMTFQDARSKLVLLVPYYSIEAWLYCNRQVAVDLCHQRHQGRGLPQLEAWASAPHSLEEVVKPKEQLCLHDRHNAELADEGFPAEKLYELNQSFTETVHRFMACTPLFALLNTSTAASPG